MMNGDISNSTPPRLIVVAEAVVSSVEEREESTSSLKKLFSKTPEKSRKVKWNAQALSHLWRVADSYGLSVELAGYEADGWTQDDLDKLMGKLDARGGNPFNYAQVYTDFHELVDELPYRGNLRAVVDVPGGVARYGSWGLEFQNL